MPNSIPLWHASSPVRWKPWNWTDRSCCEKKNKTVVVDVISKHICPLLSLAELAEPLSLFVRILSEPERTFVGSLLPPRVESLRSSRTNPSGRPVSPIVAQPRHYITRVCGPSRIQGTTRPRAAWLQPTGRSWEVGCPWPIFLFCLFTTASRDFKN